MKDEKDVGPFSGTSNALHIDVPQSQLAIPDVVPRRTRSPRPLPVIPPTKASTAPETRAIRDRENHDVAPSHLLAPLSEADLPARTRSPVPRKKVPQERDVNVATEEPRRPASPLVHDQESEVDGFVSVDAEPEVVVQGPPSGANLRRAGKVNRSKRVANGNDQPEAGNVPPKTPTFRNPTLQAVPDKGTVRAMSPPPRVPSRNEARTQESKGKSGTGHRATWDGHGQTFAQSLEAASPLPALRPLSPPAAQNTQQTQKQHNHHEVHQMFRPPTPPITSHYRKKRSYDQLPAEAFGSFMKPPVHVVSTVAFNCSALYSLF